MAACVKYTNVPIIQPDSSSLDMYLDVNFSEVTNFSQCFDVFVK